MISRLKALSVSLLLLAAGCSPGAGNNGRGPYMLDVLDNNARVTHQGRTSSITSRARVAAGDTVAVPEGSSARLTYPGGWVLELFPGELRVLSAGRVELIRGNLLVQPKAPLRVSAGPLNISAGGGLFRVDKDVAVRVGNYSSDRVRVQSGGSTVLVPRYRQAIIAGGIVPRAAKPLQFSAADRWDRRLLSSAIDLDSRLANFARGLEAQLGEGGGLEFFRRSSPPGPPVEFLEPFLVARRSDLLIGLLLAFESLESAEAPFDRRFERIFRLSEDGATWGLIAQEFGVTADGLFARLVEAIERSKISVIGPGPGLLKPPPTNTRRGASRPAPRPPARPPAVGSTPRSPAPRPTVLPGEVTRLLPPEVKDIVDDLYGVVDPVVPLPRVV